MAGYSGTPLVRKLGFKPNFRCYISGTPADYKAALGELPTGVHFSKKLTRNLDLVHFFFKKSSDLRKKMPALRKSIKENGMIWVSWPKKSSRVATDITEDVVREVALYTGLVDTKVCAVDTVWSALKLVIPTKMRREEK